MVLGASVTGCSSSHLYSEIFENFAVKVFEKKLILLAFSQRKDVELNLVSFC